jgi:serine/threonine protein kinase
MAPEHTIGNYVLGPVLGRGGMSEIRAAEHRFLGDRVAIKLLRAHVAGAPGAAEAFLAEATRTRAIEHANVVRVLDFGIDGDDCYLVMERLDGESLAERLARTGPLDEAALRALGAAIADGLAAAHDRGIIHRDLKPANVMLAADGAPKIVDFGIARQLAADGAIVTGSRIGTLAYMAPEQLAGGLVAPCVDVWALGVLLYEACAGRLPFADFADGRAPQLVDAAPRLRSLSAVSAAFDALVAACLERDPRDRPASMRELAEALRAAPAAQRFTEDLPPEIEPPALVPPRRRPRWLGGAFAALGVLASVAVGITVARHAHTAISTPLRAASPPVVELPPPPPSIPPAPPPPPAVTAVTIEVRSAPAGANVLVDGKRVGVTPTTLAVELPASIVLTRAGYQPARLTADHAGPIDVRLTPTKRPAKPRAGETLD